MAIPQSVFQAPAAAWLVALVALLMAVNALRAFTSPVAFASYLGLPLADPKDGGLVQIYGLRAAFLGLFAAILLAQSNFEALKWYALAAAIMPIGDALLTYRASAPAKTVARHVAIAVYLLITFYFLNRAA